MVRSLFAASFLFAACSPVLSLVSAPEAAAVSSGDVAKARVTGLSNFQCLNFPGAPREIQYGECTITVSAPSCSVTPSGDCQCNEMFVIYAPPECAGIPLGFPTIWTP